MLNRLWNFLKAGSYFLIYAFLLILNTLQAQIPQISVSAASKNIQIGDYLQLTLTLQAPQGLEINFPQYPTDLDSSGWELLRTDELKVSPQNGDNVYQQTIILTAWEAGQKIIPPLNFGFINAGVLQPISSQPLTIGVANPPLVDSNYIAGIKPILIEEKTWADYLFYLYWTLAALLIFAALAAVWYILKNQPAIAASAEELALAELQKLSVSNYLNEKNFIAYHSEISLILRRYLQIRFKYKALSMTTTQISLEIAARPLTANFRADASELLTTADLIKFAKLSPLDRSNLFAFQTVEKLVLSVQNELITQQKNAKK